MPGCALISPGIAESFGETAVRDEGSSASAFRGLVNALLLELGFGYGVFLLFTEWRTLLHPIVGLAQHVGAAALSVL